MSRTVPKGRGGGLGIVVFSQADTPHHRRPVGSSTGLWHCLDKADGGGA